VSEFGVVYSLLNTDLMKQRARDRNEKDAE